MRGITCWTNRCLNGLIILLFILIAIAWWDTGNYLYEIEVECASEGIQRAKLKMGPEYKYYYDPLSERLYVKLKGKWRRLKYE